MIKLSTKSLPFLLILLTQYSVPTQAEELAIQHPLTHIQQWQPEIQTPTQEIAFKDFTTQLNAFDLIYVGEVHTRYADHLTQLALLDRLYQQSPKLVIGVEWFQYPYQAWLDAYIAGLIDEAEMLHRTEYYQRWRVDYRHIQPIMRYAKQHRIRVLALNAPSEITSKISSQGKERLALIEQVSLPPIHPPSDTQRERLLNVFEGKIPPNRNVEDYLYAQRVWDETMAYNLVQFLNQNPGFRAVVFAGNFHIANGEAIPKDVKRQRPDLMHTTVSSGSWEQFKPDYVDYFVYTQPIVLPATGRLGAEVNRDNACVMSILVGQAAEKAGLQPNDCIQKINQVPIRFYADLIHELNQTQPGQEIAIQFQRGNQTLNKRIQLGPFE